MRRGDEIITPAQARAHWRKVLATSGLPQISYLFAKEALETLGEKSSEDSVREPGSD